MNRTMGRRLSIRTLLIGQFAVVVAVAALVVAVLVIGWHLPLADEQNRLEQTRAAALAVQRVEMQLDAAEQLAKALSAALAETPVTPDRYLASRDSLVNALVQETGFVQGLYWVDSELVLRGLVVQIALRDASALARPGLDLSRLPVLLAARDREALTWSDQYPSPVLGVPVVALAQPLRGGVLVLELSVERLGEAVTGMRPLEGLMTLVTDGKGEVVSAPGTGAMMHRRNVANLPVIEQALAGKAPHGRVVLEGQRFDGQAQRLDRIDWVVFAGYPASVAEVSQRAAIGITGITLLAAIGVGLLLFSLTATTVQRHLQRSIGYARAVAAGRVNDRMPDSRVAELHALDGSLSEMARQIERREAQLRAIIDQGPSVAVQIYDRQTHVVYWNPASERVLGFARDDAMGRRPVDLYYSPEQQQAFEQAIADIQENGRPIGPMEDRIRWADGQERWIISTVFTIPDPESGEPLFVCMDLDITENKRLESELRAVNASLEERVQQRTLSLGKANAELQKALDGLRAAQERLVQADKLAALGSLVAGVAHELNTPLGNALMAVTTLHDRLDAFRDRMTAGLRRSDLDGFVGQVDTAQTIAERNLHRAAELLTSFKQVAVDQTSSQRRRFDLAELVRENLMTLNPVLKHHPVTVHNDVPPGITLDSYPGPLGQVLTNLIQNALVHAFDGRSAGTIRLSATAQDESVVIRVDDDGVGIPLQARHRVFEPFFTTRLGQGGSGLGLHIVHNIVTGMLGGHIDLDSTEGVGTTFRITVARTAPVNSPPPPAS